MRVSRAFVLAGILAALTAAGAQPKGLKVLVLYDMEGASGASSVRHTDFGAEPEYTGGASP